MKMKSAIAALLLACTALPLCAQNAAPSAAQIKMKLVQIELEVALKQFEKVATLLADASIEHQLLEAEGLNDAQREEKANKAENKIKRLELIKDRLQAEIQERSAQLESIRVKLPALHDYNLLPAAPVALPTISDAPVPLAPSIQPTPSVTPGIPRAN